MLFLKVFIFFKLDIGSNTLFKWHCLQACFFSGEKNTTKVQSGIIIGLMVSITFTFQNLMKRILENFQISMVSEEVGGWVEDGVNIWCMLLLDTILADFPKEVILAHS